MGQERKSMGTCSGRGADSGHPWICSSPMKTEAAGSGVLDTPFGKFARLQILTIEDLFAGKKPAMPPEDPAAFKRAAREEDKTRQGKLL